MRFEIKDGDGKVKGTEDRAFEIPSRNLKTDKNFTIDVGAESAVDIVIHFDLSMSVVTSGPPSNPKYSLKPVMHLFDNPLQAATIQGSINNSSFGSSGNATIVVIAQSNGEEFTRVQVSKIDGVDSTPFSIYWLVPNESYKVQIDLNKDTETIDNDCRKSVNGDDLKAGSTYELNDGDPIDKDDINGICI
jgi:hypothetical protein